MKTLHLAIHSGDVKELHFENIAELIIYCKQLADFDCVWLITDGDNEDNPYKQEIVITENIFELIKFIQRIDPDTLFIQEYQSYQDAYEVALMMREPNPKCYRS